ncbi:MAG: hypothetical protein ABFR65_08705 [Pseudomonadota bacterium]
MLFARNDKYTSVTGALLLCLALLCAQGTRLHVHFLDCEHAAATGLATTDDNHGHAQHSKIHLVTDNSHHHHSETEMSELDVSPQGLLKKLPGINSLFLAIVCIFTLLLPVFTRQAVQRHSGSRFKTLRYYALSPPLRAPPRA